MKTIMTVAVVTAALAGVANAEGRYEATPNATNGVWVLDTETGEVKGCMVLRGDRLQGDNTVSCTPWSKSEEADE